MMIDFNGFWDGSTFISLYWYGVIGILDEKMVGVVKVG